MTKEQILKRFETPEQYREYNRQRYQNNKRKCMLSKVNSIVKMLRNLGCTVTPPPDDQLNAAIDNYLANQPHRERIDWEAMK